MVDLNKDIIVYGTSQAEEELRQVALGELSFIYSSQAIHRISWQGVELVRAIVWPIRDKDWGTYPQTTIEETVTANGETFDARIKFTVANGELDCDLAIHATGEGQLKFDIAMTPVGGPFATNRAGFTVLHPIKGVAGAALKVTHSNGEVEQTKFPRLISPGQPVFDIAGLNYSLHGKTAGIAFSGEIFEMEDQRNWSDASYKTYCVPLLIPSTYPIEKTRRQSIDIRLSGLPSIPNTRTSAPAPIIRSANENAPAIGLAAEPGWIDTQFSLADSGVGHIRVRIPVDANQTYLEDVSRLIADQEVEIELVIGDNKRPRQALEASKQTIAKAGLHPIRIIALREAFLASHQPSGPWPEGPVPSEVIAEARDCFGELEIGGGMLTNFTELNRCRPDAQLCDFITHGTTAIVHASDDNSVCQTLETLPQIFESAGQLAQGKPYRLGLVSIGMRSNPYGSAVAENPEQVRRTMAREDPRQRGLFAAAWAVGALAGTGGQGITSLCLAAPTGPFGIYYASQAYPQPYFDSAKDALVYPLYHVVKMAAQMAGKRRIFIENLPDGVFAYGIQTQTGRRLMLANVTPAGQRITLPGRFHATIMNSLSFVDSTRSADWLEIAQQEETSELELEAFGVAFIHDEAAK